jgi:hypothetical protein
VAGQSGDLGKQINAAGSLSWWIFAPARNRVLLYQAHAQSPILEVGAGGAVREVPVQAPKGYVLDGVLSANDRWIMRFRRESLSGSGEIDARPEASNYVLYEVDSSDGSLRRRIDVGGRPPIQPRLRAGRGVHRILGGRRKGDSRKCRPSEIGRVTFVEALLPHSPLAG